MYSVAIFFGLSGFLIHQSASNSKGLRDFAIRRLRRIFPAFIVVLFTTSIIYYPLYEYYSQGQILDALSREQISYIGKNLFLHVFTPDIGDRLILSQTQEWNPSLWTLEYEFILYFLCYFSCRFLKDLQIYLSPLFFVSFAILAQLLPHQTFLRELSYLAQFFLIGMLIWQYKKLIQISSRNIVVLIIGIGFSYSFLKNFTITSGLLILLLLMVGIRLKPGKYRNSDYSYGIYLHAGPITHLVVLVIKESHLPILIGYILSVSLSVVAGYISWNLVEARFDNKKQRKSLR